MITLYIVGKHTPVVLKSARFKRDAVEGITVDGRDVVVSYTQIKDMQTLSVGDPMKENVEAQPLII